MRIGVCVGAADFFTIRLSSQCVLICTVRVKILMLKARAANMICLTTAFSLRYYGTISIFRARTARNIEKNNEARERMGVKFAKKRQYSPRAVAL
jgi:hypothetical protein